MQQLLSVNKWEAISPDDAVDLPAFLTNTLPTTAIYVGTGGDVSAVSADGVAATFKNVPSGAFLWLWARRVNATGTTAQNLLACYAR